MTGHSDDLFRWRMCGAEHPTQEGGCCNRGRGHGGEHWDCSPDMPARVATVWYRWPRAEKAQRKARRKTNRATFAAGVVGSQGATMPQTRRQER